MGIWFSPIFVQQSYSMSRESSDSMKAIRISLREQMHALLQR